MASRETSAIPPTMKSTVIAAAVAGAAASRPSCLDQPSLALDKLPTEAGQSAILSSLAERGKISTRTVFQAIELGDPVAAKIVDDAIRLICINLGGVVKLLDIKPICYG